MHYVPQPPYLHSSIPFDDIILCSSILDSTLVVNKKQAIGGVGVAQPICIVIHEEYEWEFEHQHLTKDDSLPFKPPPFFPDIFGEPAIPDFACVSPSTDEPIVDRLLDTLDVGPSFDNEGDKFFIENPLDLSCAFSRSTEGEFVLFSSTTLFDSSDHEDIDEIVDFSDRGYRDPYTSIFDHDHESIAVDLSKPPSMMIYLMMKLKHPRLSRHFNLS